MIAAKPPASKVGYVDYQRLLDNSPQMQESRTRLEREVASLEASVSARSHVIARTFERVCAVLERLGYLAGGQVTPDGRRLGDLYTELDLLAGADRRTGSCRAGHDLATGSAAQP